LLLGCAVLTLAGCGSRASYWDIPISTESQPITPPIGLANGVVLVDDPTHRALVLTATADHNLITSPITVGHGYSTNAPLPDGTETLLLSAGDWPRKTEKDQWPSLTIVGIDYKSATHPVTSKFLELTGTQPQSTLAIDTAPVPRYAIAYQGPGATKTYATNPNEIVIFDLIGDDPKHPLTTPRFKQRTIRSFGGTPQRLTFGPKMMLPANSPNATERRLLFVETTIDVTLVDLNHAFDDPPAPDITIRLTNGSDATPVTPAGIAIDTAPDDGRFALRTKEGSNVYTVQLVPTPPPGSGDAGAGTTNDFTPTINLTDVGGVPSDIGFVNTFQGLRVAALVPTKSQAVLLEPDTSVTTPISLASPYSRMSLVTDIVLQTNSPTSSSADVAMLWAENTSSPGIGLWTLGDAVGQPYRSVEVLSVQDPIASVMDLPAQNLPKGPDPVTHQTYQQNLKILQTSQSSAVSFYVLNLVDRTASPLLTTGTPTLAVAPDGERVWAYTPNGTDLAQFDLSNLNPLSLTTEQPISGVFDVGDPGVFVPNTQILERTLIAIHTNGSFGATLFDAKTPDTATSHQSVALLLEGP
jgi:hypothetical protein